MKVLHGMSEVAGQGIYSVKGLRANGVDAHLATWRKNPGRYETEYELQIGYNKLKYPYYVVKMIKFAVKAAREYDCFHFHFCHSLLPYNVDLWFLRKMKKKLFFEFHGSELRGMLKDMTYKYEPTPKKKYSRQVCLRRIAKYADGFILHDEELREHLPDGDVPVYIVPLRLEIDKFSPQYPAPEETRPLIVHAPSDRDGKRTADILRALDRLEVDFRLILVEGKTQEEALKIYREADIVIDQISVGSYGVFAVEAMAFGKPVICYISEEMKEKLPQDLPIVSAEPFDMKERVEELIKDGMLRNRLGRAGRQYVERHHDYVKNGKQLKDIYEGARP